MPKKQKNLIEFYNNAIVKFESKVIHYIFEQFDMNKIKVFIVAGPGNAKRRFMDKISNIANHEKDLNLRGIVE